ncbi:MAG TPA: class I SAM-dependent methyltransferase [Bryobacteraceae bacterium]|nr:class I SAM-dependent methyltransferase [Bryobacteraceae bacterium]
MVRHFHESVRLERRLGCADSIGEQMAKWAEELMTLRSAYDLVHQKRSTVGTMPPTPHTACARAGAVLVRIIQRMLFWYTPQITSYQEAVARTLNHVCATAEAQLATARYLSAEIAELRREMSSLSVRQSPAPAIAPPPDEALPEAFYAAFQEQFRGPEHDVEANLHQYLQILGECNIDPSGNWLDIGCGRGEWLQCASAAGHRALGVDSSAAAVAHCRER